MFNFNVAGASTPYGNQANQFKKPYILDYNKTPNVKKFSISEDPDTPESAPSQHNGLAKKDNEGVTLADGNPLDNNGLSTIMETTEHRFVKTSIKPHQ